MKNNNTPHRVPRYGRHALVFLSAAMLLFLSTSLCLAAGDGLRGYHGSGTLTSFDNGTVMIDEKGYNVDPSVLVENAKGRSIPLNKLPIPASVNFKYAYQQKAPKTMAAVIVYIKETKKPTTKRRSTR